MGYCLGIAILAGCAGTSGHYETCRVKALQIKPTGLRHENYIALCADNAGREGVVVFKETVSLGQMVSFTPYQIDDDTQTYYGYVHHP